MLRKKISSKVVGTGPFVERRVRIATASNNRYRRAGDIPPGNLRGGRVISSVVYGVSSGRVKGCRQDAPGGRILDFRA